MVYVHVKQLFIEAQCMEKRPILLSSLQYSQTVESGSNLNLCLNNIIIKSKI